MIKKSTYHCTSKSSVIACGLFTESTLFNWIHLHIFWFHSNMINIIVNSFVCEKKSYKKLHGTRKDVDETNQGVVAHFQAIIQGFNLFVNLPQVCNKEFSYNNYWNQLKGKTKWFLKVLVERHWFWVICVVQKVFLTHVKSKRVKTGFCTNG